VLAQTLHGKIQPLYVSSYLTDYDYSRTYALELCLLTVKSHGDMVNVRHSLLRSHVESREHKGGSGMPALTKYCAKVALKALNKRPLASDDTGLF